MDAPRTVHSSAASPDAGPTNPHDILIANLLYSSMHLAHRSIQTTSLGFAGGEFLGAHSHCLECRMGAVGGVLKHTATCNAGRVLDLLTRICAAASEPTLPPTSTGKEIAQPDAPESVEMGTSPRSPLTNELDRSCAAEIERRVMACLDFCEGISTDDLEQQLPLKDLSADIGRQIAAGKVLALGVRR